MIQLELLFIFPIIIFFVYQIILITLTYKTIFLKKARKKQQYTFKVSILIAARNEEKNIEQCLMALDQLNYSKELIDIHVGDDNSEDQTASKIKDFIKNKPNFKYHLIDKTLGKARGKANVLAQLAHHAVGDVYFITDADITVSPNWITGMLSEVNETIGIVSGSTKVEYNNLFEYCQNLDWIYAFGMVNTVSNIGIPVSAVGNNMLISKEAYWATGGYESFDFSVTEDLKLFQETLKKGYEYKNTMQPEVIATTKPMKNFSELISQRNRWMTGAMQIPMILKLFLFLTALFYPLVILNYFFTLNINYSFSLIIVKIFLQSFYLYSCKKHIKTHFKLFDGLVFEIYSTILSFWVIINHFTNNKVIWKGRNYQK